MLKGLKNAVVVGIGAFFLAIIVNTTSQNILNLITSIPLAFVLLLLIILIGIIFDIIGVAVAVASETSFHSRAAKKISGAKHAIYLVRNAGKVANFSADVVGDISGTLSGAIGVAIIFRIFTEGTSAQVFANTVITATVAALTIGGKAWGKKIALEEADEIIFKVGRILAWLERNLGIRLIKIDSKKGRRI